jgi:hypothetical protein
MTNKPNTDDTQPPLTATNAGPDEAAAKDTPAERHFQKAVTFPERYGLGLGSKAVARSLTLGR